MTEQEFESALERRGEGGGVERRGEESEQCSIHGLLRELGEHYQSERSVVLNTVYTKLLRKQV